MASQRFRPRTPVRPEHLVGRDSEAPSVPGRRSSDFDEIANRKLCPGTLSGPFPAEGIYRYPIYEELVERFSRYVDERFKVARFDPIGLCLGISSQQRVVNFYLWKPSEAVFMESALEAINELPGNLRPALYPEAIGFADQWPRYQQENPILVAGSTTRDGKGAEFVAWLTCQGRDARVLRLAPIGYLIGSDTAVLLVERQPQFEEDDPFKDMR